MAIKREGLVNGKRIDYEIVSAVEFPQKERRLLLAGYPEIGEMNFFEDYGYEKRTVAGVEYSYYEDVNKYDLRFKIAAAPVNEGASNVRVTITGAEFYGEKGFTRLYPTCHVQLAADIQARVQSIDTTNPGAHTALLAPIDGADIQAAAAQAGADGTTCLIIGDSQIEAGDKVDGFTTSRNEFSARIGATRKSNSVTDLAQVSDSWIQFPDGSYKVYSQDLNDLSAEYTLTKLLNLMEGRGTKTETDIDGKLVYQTRGLIPTIKDRGFQFQVPVGGWTVSELKDYINIVISQLGSNSNLLMSGFLSMSSAIEDLLLPFAQGNDSSFNFAEAGMNREQMISLGIDGLRFGGRSVYFREAPIFTHATLLGGQPQIYGNQFALSIPMGSTNATFKDGAGRESKRSVKKMCMVWAPHGHQNAPSEETATWSTGAMSATNKTNINELIVNMFGFYGFELRCGYQFGYSEQP